MIQAGNNQTGQVFTWTQPGGFVSIPALTGAFAISDDGQMILGNAPFPEMGRGSFPALWTAQFGAQPLAGLLVFGGLSRNDAFGFTAAGFAAGSTIDRPILVGTETDRAAFVTDVPLIPAPAHGALLLLGLAAVRRRR